jgi:hypothetical protein
MRILIAVKWGRLELNRVSGSSVLESDAFADVSVESTLLACRDTRNGEIIGCARATRADQLLNVEGSRAEYHLTLFQPEHLVRAAVATRLALLKAHRKSVASLVLLDKMYALGLEQKYLFCLLSCEPGLYSGYLRLGFRPLGPVHGAPKGGFRIPMLMINHDLEHLQKCGSPLARAYQRAAVVADLQGLTWYRRVVAVHGEIGTGIEPFSDHDGDAHTLLTADLSAKGREALLSKAMTVDCTPGQVIVREQDGGQWIGLVVSGLVQVESKGHVLAILGEGEPFGEIALVLGTPRTACVVAAAPDTRVVLLSQSALARVSGVADREKLWRNIARVLARRLARAAGEPSAESGTS